MPSYKSAILRANSGRARFPRTRSGEVDNLKFYCDGKLRDNFLSFLLPYLKIARQQAELYLWIKFVFN